MTKNTWTQYNQIVSKPLPTCEGGAVLFNFGTECTPITTDTADTYIVKSSEMCINPFTGKYLAGVYKAYQGKVDGDLVFSSTLTHIPQLFPPGTNCGQGEKPPFCF